MSSLTLRVVTARLGTRPVQSVPTCLCMFEQFFVVKLQLGIYSRYNCVCVWYVSHATCLLVWLGTYAGVTSEAFVGALLNTAFDEVQWPRE